MKSATPAPKVYYNHLDHLGGTAAVSTADGYLSQELAYYPFGAMRVDEQHGQIDQNRRYTGHEYDDETDLSYMGARYYDGQTGRFTSQDPVAAHTPEVVIKDPQQLNTYTYTRNNPLIGFDPSGLLTVFIHGTFSDQNAFSNEYMESVANDLGDTRYVNYSWSGKNDVQSRAEAAVRLAGGFEASNFADDEKLNIVAHSHGGNVAIQALNITSLDEDRVGSVILLGTPVRSDYQLNKTYSSNNLLNVYSETDGVQTNGGRIQDFGAADRTRSDGFRNLQTTYQQNPGWIDSHSELKSASVWDKIKSFIRNDNEDN